MKCPNCGRCPYLEGTCVEKIARGRRFFLMGALALPVAATIARVTPKLPYEAPKLTYLGQSRIIVDGQEWTYEANGEWPWHGEFTVATWVA